MWIKIKSLDGEKKKFVEGLIRASQVLDLMDVHDEVKSRFNYPDNTRTALRTCDGALYLTQESKEEIAEQVQKIEEGPDEAENWKKDA